MPKLKSEEYEQRNAEMKKYYLNLRRTGFTRTKALEMVQEKFADYNLSIRRIKNIIYE